MKTTIGIEKNSKMKTKYFNTTNVSGDQLREFVEKATKQELKIFRLFKEHTTLNPTEIMRLKPDILRGSLSRSLANLTKQGHLVKLDKMVIGSQGRLEHYWQLPQNYIQAKLF